MSTTAPAPAFDLRKRGPWATVLLASLGSTFEMYDFIIYGVFAREIGATFFPGSDPVSHLLGTYAVFAVGYVARPLGGLLLGSLGDRTGRRGIFLISIIAMSLATIGIACVPSFNAIGLAAPVLLVLLRVVQGVFLAGELPCSIVYVVEEMPDRAGIATGTVVACASAGVFVATIVSLGIHLAFTDTSVAWRLAFLLGGAFGLLSYKFRTSMEESQGFRLMKSQVARAPLRETLRTSWARILIGIGIACVVNTSNISLFVVLPSYFTAVLHTAPATASAAQNIGLVFNILGILAVALLTQRIAPRLLHRAGAVLLLCGAYPLYRAIGAGDIGPYGAYITLGLVTALVSSPYGYLLADLFPTRIRFTGVALALNLSTMLFTAVTPFATTLLLSLTHLREAPGLVLSGAAALALIANLWPRQSMLSPPPALALGR